MKNNALKTFLMILLCLVFLTSQVSAAMPSLNDLMNRWYETRASEEFYKTVTGKYTNSTNLNVDNESVTLVYGSQVNVTRDDIYSLVVYDRDVESNTVGSGNYSVNYSNGGITLNDYANDKKNNESMTLTYGVQVNFSLRTYGVDSIDAVFTRANEAQTIGSGNYSSVLTAGTAGITLTSYQLTAVNNETINLTPVVGKANVSHNAFGVASSPVVVVMNTSGYVIPAADYTFTYATGNLLLTNQSNPLTNTSVNITYTYNNNTWSAGVNYTYNNATWAVGVNYSNYNKISINCTRPSFSSSQMSFIKKIDFMSLDGLKKVELWRGLNVVNELDGLSNHSMNVMGGAAYLNVSIDHELEFSRSYWDKQNQYSLKIEDGTGGAGNLNNTPVTFTVVCGIVK